MLTFILALFTGQNLYYSLNFPSYCDVKSSRCSLVAFAGHYMSASALMWASTHNDTLYGKMTSVVDALYDCQKQMGTGYLSAFPTELFDRFEAVKYVWAPYYTIHKVGALHARSSLVIK